MTGGLLRTIPASMEAGIVSAVDDRLRGVAAEHHVTIPWAIESGSRAWGFPSPDSDYDCRFFFVRSVDSYLSPWAARDVIETPLDKVFDVNGWDVIKAVRLLVRGNQTVTEWLRSPIVYNGDTTFRDEMFDLAAAVYDPVKATRHYRHVGLQQRETPTSSLTLKRVFYALRPAATLHWLRAHPAGGVPPMDLPTLLTESDPGRALREAVDALIAVKATTRELGTGAVPPVILDFIEDELERAAAAEDIDLSPNPDAISLGERWFRSTVERWGPGSG